MSKRLLLLAVACLFLAGGCNLIYKQNIQQGNALEQEDLDQLELGMTKNQVSFLLGTPAIQDPFNHDRWDYISTFSRRGGDPVRRLVSLEFENDRLSSMTGVNASESESVLTAEGARPVEPSSAPVGVKLEDARDYEDLRILRPGEGLDSWSVQVGSFASRSAANRRVAALAEAGIQAVVYGQVVSDRGFFIVRSGSFDSHQAALAAAESIEATTGIRAYVVTPGG